MVRLVRSEQMALFGLVLLERKLEWFWFRIYRVWWVPWWLTWHLCLYICEKYEMSRLWHTHGRTHGQWKVVQYSVWAGSAIFVYYVYIYLHKKISPPQLSSLPHFTFTSVPSGTSWADICQLGRTIFASYNLLVVEAIMCNKERQRPLLKSKCHDTDLKLLIT